MENTEELEQAELNSPEAFLAKATEQQKADWLLIYASLCSYERYNEFIKNNFNIQKVVNDEEKKIVIQVTPTPIAVGPKLSGDQIFKIHALLAKNGVKDAVATTKSLMTVLGQEKSNIVLATESESIETVKNKIKKGN